MTGWRHARTARLWLDEPLDPYLDPPAPRVTHAPTPAAALAQFETALSVSTFFEYLALLAVFILWG
mgnify:CR=1 FL=1